MVFETIAYPGSANPATGAILVAPATPARGSPVGETRGTFAGLLSRNDNDADLIIVSTVTETGYHARLQTKRTWPRPVAANLC
jgi:hypothetical protein